MYVYTVGVCSVGTPTPSHEKKLFLLKFLFRPSRYSIEITEVSFSLIQPRTVCCISIKLAQVSIQSSSSM